MRGMSFARLGPPLAIGLLAGPVLAGLAGTLFPAFGWLPALGGDRVSLDPFRELLAQPGLFRSSLVSLLSGLAATLVALLGVALFSSALATTAFAGLSWGQLLVFVLHVLPVAAAWLYIRSGS